MRQFLDRSSRPHTRLLAAALMAVTVGFAALLTGAPAHAYTPAFRTVTAYPTSGQFYNVVSEKDGRCIDVRDAPPATARWCRSSTAARSGTNSSSLSTSAR